MSLKTEITSYITPASVQNEGREFIFLQHNRKSQTNANQKSLFITYKKKLFFIRFFTTEKFRREESKNATIHASSIQMSKITIGTCWRRVETGKSLFCLFQSEICLDFASTLFHFRSLLCWIRKLEPSTRDDHGDAMLLMNAIHNWICKDELLITLPLQLIYISNFLSLCFLILWTSG